MDSVIKYYVCLPLDTLKLSGMPVMRQSLNSCLFLYNVDKNHIRTLTNERLVWTFFCQFRAFLLEDVLLSKFYAQCYA